MIPLHTPHTAKYYQLSRYIHQQIIAGELSPAQQLPTEDALAEQFGVSRGTVRKAVDLLEGQGLVRREQGRGTFVNDLAAKGMAGFMLSDFANEMQRQQRQPKTTLLQQAIIKPTEDVETLLDLPAESKVIHIQRLRLADNQPIIVEERFLSVDLCPELATEDVESQSIHWLLVHKYKLPLVRVSHTVEMGEVGKESAKWLNLQPNDSVFAVERLTFTRQNDAIRPAVLYRALCHGEEYQFKAQFNTLI